MHRYHSVCWKALVIAAVSHGLCACVGSPPRPLVDYKPDYNFSTVQTVAFYGNSGEVTADHPLDLDAGQKEHIDSALRYALRNKGLEVVDDASQADLLVSWHLVTQPGIRQRNREAAVENPYHSYDRYASYQCWGCLTAEGDTMAGDNNHGVLIVDLIDPRSQISVWRSINQSMLRGNPVADTGKYNAAATNVLACLPAR